MSTAWGLYCATCPNLSPTWFEKGHDEALFVAENAPLFKALIDAYDAYGGWRMTIEWAMLDTYDDPMPERWAAEHAGHTLWLANEYGDIEPIATEGPPNATTAV